MMRQILGICSRRASVFAYLLLHCSAEGLKPDFIFLLFVLFHKGGLVSGVYL